MIRVRDPETIYRTDGAITNGSTRHFPLGGYHDPRFEDFGRSACSTTTRSAPA